MSWPIAFYSPVATNTITKDEEKERKAKMSSLIERYKDKVSSLPMNVDHDLCKYMGFWHFHGFWYHSKADFSVEAIMALQDHFEAQPTDIFLASHPKSGTTWLKALAFAIMNRNKFKTRSGSCPTHPLLTISPHDCVPFMESESFLNNPSFANGLMHTHIPYTSLPKSIISSDCRIVYLCRNPKDVLTSYWHFLNKLKDDGSTPTKLDDAFELFSRGMSPYGSFWDHVIGYYKASLEQPLKVLFLKYEDLKKNPENEVTKLAKFIGNPFTEEEEFDGSVKKIIELCGFENLSKVNKDGKQTSKVLSDDIYFRKGIVGDSVNYLTNEMIQTLDKITKEKFDGLSISFEA
ncbi:putative Sulfotransferase domain, P-loop containing nucleoside triphosphate hydrolase [Helianthus annuus]|uniref:Sulfotransferase n=2 Tax=Helianthus annuus TaxID=4232 RepID=A0A9K3HT23_HELAN|nr:flavonol sulfotransferase-like [Helianthus annuus]KAF5784224.1 putative Sulfotransferase domain, P-loop containing nucleoside triphosphate hydrolase [Helianthus annuus]KAJ0503431.1 putative Sulfotransferase domain, P-loop containing nucleoside triphosphate hydrolase [Helianthus annuus]KAJ0519394.1 putative Sulfotransferase domain, P-loop containing nucleoside triphosphate hydrolase [Helianthus annuus]KAJ0687398.1 putative Sulfotransferase domain, P-loop containing nucleoside triphosphate hyd